MFTPVIVVTWLVLAILVLVARDMDFLVFFGSIAIAAVSGVIFIALSAAGLEMPSMLLEILQGIAWFALTGWIVVGAKAAIVGDY